MNFKPGDMVLFDAAAVFKGTLKIGVDDSGSLGKPVVFTSYGGGKTTINAGGSSGMLVVNASNIVLANIKVVGDGVEKNNGSGIFLYAEDSLHAPHNIRISNCEATGFHQYGILIGCSDNIDLKGYEQVNVEDCIATNNGEAGIASYGSVFGFQHKNFKVTGCKAYNNSGIVTKTTGHSGNGIVMGEVDGLLIDHCTAFENGADNRCEAGGPVGIWVWMCKKAVIQYCVAHDNHTGSTKDGGGFDIDGGSSDCVMQFNYSYNNDGAGYLLAEYGALFPFSNNVVRFNVSENDGRKNNYGAIAVWGASEDYKVTNSKVYNNTVYTDDRNISSGTPACITLMGVQFDNVLLENNIFSTKGVVNFINADTSVGVSKLLLKHNVYYSYSGNYNFKYGERKFSTINAWLGANKQQEDNGQSLMQVNPFFTGESKFPVNHFDPVAYSLLPKSSLRKNPYQITGNINAGMRDIAGNTIPSDDLLFPGACMK
ncbi:MAG TPA: right-handed parallel beta-helix repeat-containing protein [Panacibacter sp.]|nr:right-handed parallel beta-helix repeat-containing protein [Panacibacter sp.]HNP44877.1 right-handed parallel beta-helix repeat-containing protein [Panacibacter sp.]